MVSRKNPQRGQLIYLQSDDQGKSWSAPTLVADEVWWPMPHVRPPAFHFSADHVGCFAFDRQSRPLIYRSVNGGQSWTKEFVALSDQLAAADARRIPLATLHDIGMIYAVVTDEKQGNYRLCRCQIAAADFRAWTEGVAVTGELPLLENDGLIVGSSGTSAMEAVTYVAAGEEPERLEVRLAVTLDEGRTWKELTLKDHLDGQVQLTALEVRPERICLAADVFNPRRVGGRHQLIVQEIRLGTIQFPDDFDVDDAEIHAFDRVLDGDLDVRGLDRPLPFLAGNMSRGFGIAWKVPPRLTAQRCAIGRKGQAARSIDGSAGRLRTCIRQSHGDISTIVDFDLCCFGHLHFRHRLVAATDRQDDACKHDSHDQKGDRDRRLRNVLGPAEEIFLPK